MNTLFILQRKFICELYYISVYYFIIFLINGRVFKGCAVIRSVLGLPALYLSQPGLAGTPEPPRMQPVK